MKKELVLWKADVVGLLGWVDDTICALLQGTLKLSRVSNVMSQEDIDNHQGYDVCWLRGELMGKLFVVGYEMGNVDVAIVLLYQDILSYLIPAICSALAHASSCVGLTHL